MSPDMVCFCPVPEASGPGPRPVWVCAVLGVVLGLLFFRVGKFAM